MTYFQAKVLANDFGFELLYNNREYVLKNSQGIITHYFTASQLNRLERDIFITNYLTKHLQ